MSIPMPMQETIRELDAQGVPGREIARRLGVSRNTVAKSLRRLVTRRWVEVGWARGLLITIV